MSEIEGFHAFAYTEKRISIDKLLSKVGDLFAESVYTDMPEMAQYDFTEAGKCIACELPTAAAFHVLRGTECILRKCYASHITTSPNQFLDWAKIVKELSDLNDDPLPKELLDHLDNIRKSFRNPTAHPEKRYDLDEAQDLFNLCVDVVNRIYKTDYELYLKRLAAKIKKLST
jgi:hypothetical protein